MRGIEMAFGARGVPVERAGLSTASSAIYAEIIEGLAAPAPPPPKAKPAVIQALDKVGNQALDAGRDLVALVSFFGEVVAGMDVVKKLDAQGTPDPGTPKIPLLIESARVLVR